MEVRIEVDCDRKEAIRIMKKKADDIVENKYDFCIMKERSWCSANVASHYAI